MELDHKNRRFNPQSHRGENNNQSTAREVQNLLYPDLPAFIRERRILVALISGGALFVFRYTTQMHSKFKEWLKDRYLPSSNKESEPCHHCSNPATVMDQRHRQCKDEGVEDPRPKTSPKRSENKASRRITGVEKEDQSASLLGRGASTAGSPDSYKQKLDRKSEGNRKHSTQALAVPSTHKSQHRGAKGTLHEERHGASLRDADASSSRKRAHSQPHSKLPQAQKADSKHSSTATQASWNHTSQVPNRPADSPSRPSDSHVLGEKGSPTEKDPKGELPNQLTNDRPVGGETASETRSTNKCAAHDPKQLSHEQAPSPVLSLDDRESANSTRNPASECVSDCLGRRNKRKELERLEQNIAEQNLSNDSGVSPHKLQSRKSKLGCGIDKENSTEEETPSAARAPPTSTNNYSQPISEKSTQTPETAVKSYSQPTLPTPSDLDQPATIQEQEKPATSPKDGCEDDAGASTSYFGLGNYLPSRPCAQCPKKDAKFSEQSKGLTALLAEKKSLEKQLQYKNKLLEDKNKSLHAKDVAIKKGAQENTTLSANIAQAKADLVILEESRRRELEKYQDEIKSMQETILQRKTDLIYTVDDPTIKNKYEQICKKVNSFFRSLVRRDPKSQIHFHLRSLLDHPPFIDGLQRLSPNRRVGLLIVRLLDLRSRNAKQHLALLYDVVTGIVMNILADEIFGHDLRILSDDFHVLFNRLFNIVRDFNSDDTERLSAAMIWRSDLFRMLRKQGFSQDHEIFPIECRPSELIEQVCERIYCTLSPMFMNFKTSTTSTQEFEEKAIRGLRDIVELSIKFSSILARQRAEYRLERGLLEVRSAKASMCNADQGADGALETGGIRLPDNMPVQGTAFVVLPGLVKWGNESALNYEERQEICPPKLYVIAESDLREVIDGVKLDFQEETIFLKACLTGASCEAPLLSHLKDISELLTLFPQDQNTPVHGRSCDLSQDSVAQSGRFRKSDSLNATEHEVAPSIEPNLNGPGPHPTELPVNDGKTTAKSMKGRASSSEIYREQTIQKNIGSQRHDISHDGDLPGVTTLDIVTDIKVQHDETESKDMQDAVMRNISAVMPSEQSYWPSFL